MFLLSAPFVSSHTRSVAPEKKKDRSQPCVCIWVSEALLLFMRFLKECPWTTLHRISLFHYTAMNSQNWCSVQNKCITTTARTKQTDNHLCQLHNLTHSFLPFRNICLLTCPQHDVRPLPRRERGDSAAGRVRMKHHFSAELSQNGRWEVGDRAHGNKRGSLFFAMDTNCRRRWEAGRKPRSTTALPLRWRARQI